MSPAPAIVLVRPQMGENIGAAARAMANFGLRDLRLVAPRDGWPNPKASDTAGKALPLIDDAKLYANIPEALADCQFVLATTARERTLSQPVMEVREAMADLHARVGRGERVALLFGPERTGLENEDIALADAIVTIPVAPEYASLNVGQAVVVAAYEWWQGVIRVESRESSEAAFAATTQAKSLCRADASTSTSRLSTLDSDHSLNYSSPAPRAELSGFFDQLEAALDTVNFWRVPEKKDVMWRNIRAGLLRAGLNTQEIATWRGMLKALRGE